LKLAGMTASVAGNFAKNKIKTAFMNDEQAAREREAYNRAAGVRIAETLGELKGAVMKVGQMASIAADILPKELSDALSTLQKEAPPMDFSVIAEQIEKEFGQSVDSLFKSFDRTPFAAASIGQVHRAQVDDGRQVVVKVQYPGVDEAVDSDLNHLKVALRASGLLKVPKESLDASMVELRARLHEELDYCLEADNVRAFREFHSAHDDILVPNVVGERSSQRVLTLEFEPGTHVNKLDEEGFTQKERDQLGASLWHMMARQLFHLGAIHGDPNPGNLAFRRDGTIVLYDYGCVKRVVPEIVQAYRDMVIFGIAEEYDKVDDALLRMGIRNPKGPRPEFSYYKMWRDMFALPFIDGQTFDYATSTLHDQVVAQVPGVMKRMASFQAAPEMLFIDRMVAGHYGNLRLMRSRVATWPIIESYLSEFDVSALKIDSLLPKVD
jgi:predicted unusual protein kinase regulating ubiquinone biosynthesis (AarF/ABC1/UbiB family)